MMLSFISVTCRVFVMSSTTVANNSPNLFVSVIHQCTIAPRHHHLQHHVRPYRWLCSATNVPPQPCRRPSRSGTSSAQSQDRYNPGTRTTTATTTIESPHQAIAEEDITIRYERGDGVEVVKSESESTESGVFEYG